MAVPTRGRVILETTVGEIEIELWSKENPKTTRNFLALAMEGYYDGVIFHRVVPGFLVQTGDRTGTGGGGESFYGDPFEDEIHPRLKFPHRGIVAMANNGEKDTNDSQFFITLDRADELYGKHTVFGKVVGNTIFNVLKIGEVELGKSERPIYPPKITSIRIVDNPYDDIVPRITAAEKKAQKRAREEAERQREEAQRRKNAKKNVGLLSFGDGPEEEQAPVVKKSVLARPDLIEDVSASNASLLNVPTPPSRSKPPPEASSSSKAGAEPQPPSKSDKKHADSSVEIKGIREQHAKEQASGSAARLAEIAKIEADIKRLARRQGGAGAESDEEEEDDRPSKKSKKASGGMSALEAELAKYRSKKGVRAGSGREGKKRDEGEILARLEKFKGKLKGAGSSSKSRLADDKAGAGADDEDKDRDGEGDEEDLMDVDNDTSFLTQSISFPKSHDNTAEVAKAEHDYEVIDPRTRSAAAKAEEDERRRRKEGKGLGAVFRKDGGGGGDRDRRDGERDRGGDRYGGGRRDGDRGGGNSDAPRKAFGRDAVRDRPRDRERDGRRDRDKGEDWDPGFGKPKGGGW